MLLLPGASRDVGVGATCSRRRGAASAAQPPQSGIRTRPLTTLEPVDRTRTGWLFVAAQVVLLVALVLVPTGTDAQKAADRIAAAMRENTCLRDVKIQKVVQHNAEKQKYIMEMDLRCEDKKDPKKNATTPAGAASAKKEEE